MVVALAALFGDDHVLQNIAPTFIWVAFWVGLVPFVVLFGNVWAYLSPFRAIADAVAWAGGRLASTGGRSPTRSGSGAGPPRSCSSSS